MKKIYVMLLILLGFSFLTSCQLDKDILLGNKEPHEHVLVPEWTQNDKYHWHACSGCDKIVEKEAHDFGSWVEVKEATEYEAGEEKRECICGFTETRVIERLDHTHKPTGEYGHNDKYHWETCSECDAQLNKKSHTGGVATCQEKATCSICNVQYGSLSNKHVYGEYVVISEATCKERAIEEATCTVDGCQAKDTRYVPGSTTVGHKWGEWTYIEGSATCLKDGMEERGCLTCSSKEKRSAEGTKLAHHASSEVLFDGNSHWNSCDVTKGCTEKLNVVAHSYDDDCDEVCNGCAHERQGHHTFDNACDKVCNICGAERYTPDHTGGTATCLLPAICTECGTPYGLPLEHTYHNECDATCNMCGLVTRVPKPHRGGTATCEEKAICEECGLPYGNLLSHRFGTWVSEVPATCEEDGVKAHKYCSLCEKNYDEHGNVIVSLVISAKGHKLGDLVTKVEPTCVDDGMKAHYQCLTCSEYFDANKVKVNELELVIPANGHNLTFNALVPATCENAGKLAHHHCSSCGKDYEDNEATTELTNLVIEALGHSYGEWVPAKAATCEDAGNVGYFQCSECDKYFDINRNELTSVVIDALGHSYGTTLVGKDKIHHGYKCSTCGEFKDLENHTPGAEATENTDQVCTVCNYILAPATNHVNHVADQSAWITNSTYHWHKCVGCDIVVESSKAEHDYTNTCDTTCNTCGYIREITHDYEAVITNPTCEESGYTTYTCEVCGDVKVDNYINALGHVVVIDKAKAATCEDTGLSEGSHCDRCNSVLVAQIVVDALGHEEVTHTAKAATCTEIGWDAYVTCSRCEYTTYNEIPVLGHDEVTHTAKAATCTEIGWDAYITCSRCEYTTYQEIAKLGHEVVVDDAVLPSCEESGKTAGSHCSRCNTVYVAQEEIAALGHDWKDATCTAPKTCNTCGNTEGEKLEHIFENEKEDGPRYWNECDCGQKDIVYMHVYFKPNSNWKDANAWFAAYCFGNGDKWYELKDNNSDGLYETVVDSTTYDSIIFVRMNPAKETLDWSSKWDQTVNLELQTDNKTIFTVKEGDWNNATGQWSEYSEENYVNIYFANTKEWTTVYAYAWGGSGNNAGWAGVPMTLVEKDVFGVDIYLISLNTNFVNIIFNDTSKQTVDLTVPTNGDCLFTITGESGGKYTGSWGCYHQCSEIEYNETHHYYTCTICGDVIKTEEHTNNATCDESYKCLCGKEFLAKGHTMTVIPSVDATCTVEGSTAGVKCGVCQEILVPTTVIPALGHDEVTHIAKAATCIEIGWDAYVTCNRCEHTTYNEIPALGHDEVTHIAKAATCTEIGWDAYITCNRCEYTTYNEIPALDHAYEYKYYNKAGDEITSGSEVSCTQDLVYRGTCSNDINHVTEVFVKGKDLIDNDLNITVKHDNVSPVTCVSDSVCTDCGFVMQEKTPSNHAYGAWIITQNPTASSIGVAEKDCQYCDAKEVFVVPALTKANYYDENSTLPYEYHAPTCSEKGVEIFRVIIGEQVIGEFTNELDKLDHSPEEDDNDCETPTLCEHCGEKLVDGKAHTYVDSVCSVCGKERTIEVSDLVSSDPTINQITKNSNGEQVITYGPREAAYYTVTSEVSHYTPNLNTFKFSYTANEEIQLCFSINGVIDWSSAGGHRMYPAGTHTIYLDVETYLAENATELPESFTVLIYLNATVAPESAKEIIIHSLTFTDEMIISAPKASGLECVQGENGYDISYDISYDNDAQYRNISIDVRNYSSKYNVLRIILDVPMNTNIQISVDYLDVNGEEDSQTLRSHWGLAGVVEPEGEVIFEYDLSELVSTGNTITKVVIYFDNPTEYTTNTGVVSAKLISYEFVALKLCQHDLVKTDAKAATCDEHGNYEYWTCLVCDEIFALADATEKTTVERQKLLPLGHDLVKTDAKASTCEEQGNNAYWTCEVCEKVFADEEGTQVTTVEAQKLPLAGHTPKVDDGDCTTAINCSVCGKVTTAAKAEHTPTADDGNCMTPVYCENCTKIAISGNDSHSFTGLTKLLNAESGKYVNICSECGTEDDMKWQPVYFKPNDNWKSDGARFAIYYFNNELSINGWDDLTDSNGDGIYDAKIESSYVNVIFCRMNPSTSDNNCDNRWNQTTDLLVPTTSYTMYMIQESSWDQGTWEKYHLCSERLSKEHDDTHHWDQCEVCELIFNRENHKGGEATSTSKAKCEVCGVEYGELEKVIVTLYFTLPDWSGNLSAPSLHYWGTGIQGTNWSTIEATPNMTAVSSSTGANATYKITIDITDGTLSGLIVFFKENGAIKQSVDVTANLPTVTGEYVITSSYSSWPDGKFTGVTITKK